MHRRALLFLIGLAVLPACATSARRATTEPAVATAGPSSGTVPMPVVLPAFPAPPYLDLGPLVTSAERGSMPPGEQLLVLGDELRADAFVLETRSLEEVYGVDPDRQARWRDSHPRLAKAANAIRLLVTGDAPESTEDAKGTQRAYYRAIRRVKAIPPRVDVTVTSLAPELRAELAAVKDLQEQLDIAHGLFAAGLVDTEQYRELRGLLMRLSDSDRQ